MSNDELKPCPFCGGEAETSRGLHKYDCWGVWCPTCKVRTDLYLSERKAIESWNTRYEKMCQNNAPSYLRFLCSECGYVIYHDDANETGDKAEDTPNYCLNCGCKVEH